MSHFTVLVIGDNVEDQLAPYHEFECTGEDDQYIQDVDKTEEVKQEYEADTVSRLKAPDGSLHNAYDDKFYKEIEGSDGGFGSAKRERVIPEGWEEIEVPRKEVESLSEFITSYYGHSGVACDEDPDLSEKHKYGYFLVDEDNEVTKVVDRTNPNAKWDWYTVGGRWSGFFLLKDGTTADQALKKDIDFDTMINAYVESALKTYRIFQDVLAGRELPSWDKIRESHLPDMDAARKEYNENPIIVALRDTDEFGFFPEYENYDVDVDTFIRRAQDEAISTFAFVVDGKWYEKGEMGWFAMVSNEKDKDEWLNEFSTTLKNLPDDTLLTLVDCHI